MLWHQGEGDFSPLPLPPPPPLLASWSIPETFFFYMNLPIPEDEMFTITPWHFHKSKCISTKFLGKHAPIPPSLRLLTRSRLHWLDLTIRTILAVSPAMVWWALAMKWPQRVDASPAVQAREIYAFIKIYRTWKEIDIRKSFSPHAYESLIVGDSWTYHIRPPRTSSPFDRGL